jgi:hypothetical protein
LGPFANSNLVTSRLNPQQLQPIIANLQTIIEEIPAGKIRWLIRAYLADALWHAGQAEQALPLYKLAAAEAEQAQAWYDIGWICNNWAGALQPVGH